MQETLTESFRLSAQQKHMYALSASGERSPLHYGNRVLLRLHGELDGHRLRQAFEQVIQRHEILRTTFPLLRGLSLPQQVIAAQALYSWQVQDVQALSAQEQEQLIDQALAEPQMSELDLHAGPVLHVWLFLCAEHEHALFLKLPAVTGDMQTCHLLLHEVSRVYEQGQQAEAEEEEPLQYADLAEWQYELLTSDDTEIGRAYWRKQGEHIQQDVRLPWERPREPGSVQPFLPAEQHLSMPKEVLRQLECLAQDWQVSAAALALTCWAVVLARLTQQTNLLIGTSFDGRRYAELEGAMGLLVKYLPLAYSLSPEGTYSTAAQQVEAHLREASKWQEYFSWEHFSAAGSTGEEPFCAFGFDYLAFPPAWQAGSLRLHIARHRCWLERCTARLGCVQQAETLQVMLGYDRARLAPEMAQRLLAQWQLVLLQVLAHPQRVLREIEVLTEQERSVLQQSNQTILPLPAVSSLLDLFEAQVLRDPHALALRCADEQLCYGELEQRANQLAQLLQQQGVGPEVCVGLYLPPGVPMVVALLAVLKAGGAYVPLEPSSPAPRLAFLIQDARLALLLTQEALQAQLPVSPVPVLLLETIEPLLARQPQQAPPRLLNSAQLAYVLYTSGSTGEPKGVMVCHLGLLNYLHWALQTYPLAQGAGSLVHSPLSFDLTITSLLLPLLQGRTVTLLPQQRDISVLAQALRTTEPLSLLKLTPTHLQLLHHLLPAQELAGRTAALILGGEALLGEQVRSWQQAAPETRIFNEYGPTETVVGCCVYEFSAQAPASGAVPIGLPIANTRLYVLDAAMRLVPLGVTGELYIAGLGLARGYRQRPALTAERFVPDPFALSAGERLYRTGDLVRQQEDGTLVFVGRTDTQVKVHGYRIELGEIEAALLQHPHIREAAVLLLPGTDGEPRLVASFVEAGEEGEPALSVEALRQQVLSLLPDYMVPAVFVRLSQMPLTSNGKLDRQALEQWKGSGLQDSGAYVAPRTLAEEVLAGAWSQVLGIEQVSIDANYFALGGDSIRSIQVITLAQERGLQFSVNQLFGAPTIRQLAELLQQEQQAQDDLLSSQVQQPFALLSQADRQRLPAEVEDAYPLTMLQGGMLFHNEYSPGEGVYHDIFSYHVRIAVELELLQQAAQALVERHPMLRTTFDLTSYSQPVQLVYRSGVPILSSEDIQGLEPEQQEQQIRQWIAAEKQRGFDWRRLPLARMQIHVRSQQTIQFTLSFHHAIIDGWSDATLLTELFSHYFALLHQRPFELRPPQARYRDFVALEQAAVSSEACQDYWDRTLAHSSFTAIPRWSQAPGPGGVVVQPVPLSQEVSQGLKQLALATAVPIKNVLLAGHLRVLSVLSGQEDVMTCVVSGGRPEGRDGERVLGLFINSIPFRQQLRGGTWRELVTQTFEKEREALPYRRYPMAEMKHRHGGLRLSETLFYFTHYHILSELQEQKEIEILGWIPHEVTSFPLAANFRIDPANSDVNLSLTCDGSQFSVQQVEAIAGYYAATLTAMATAGQEHYETHDVLSVQERQQILLEWNATQRDGWPPLGLHHLFEAQVERTPDAAAVVFDHERLSYGRLNQRANQLAHYLHQQGVGPDTPVGVMMERSVDLVVSLLAILKAGGAYVPIEPSYPVERREALLTDAQVPLLLTQARFQSYLPPATVRQLVLEQEETAITHQDTSNPASGVTPEHLAYIIYTSGSTGKPKGVMNTHRGIVNRLLWMRDAYQLTPTDRVLQKTPFSFDVSVWEIFWPLLTGACLVIAKPEGHRESAYLQQLIVAEGITTVHFVPSMLNVFLQEPDVETCVSLRRIFCSGEALSIELQDRCFARLPVELHNLYGPTEAAIDVTFWECERTANLGLVPIGRPIANTQIYILAPHLEPVPVGVAGELYIGGVGVARGYVNRPELTAERFVPDPFAEVAGARLYQTGDVARYRPDGIIEFLGRIDHQVKLRGFRIELGEIETALERHPGVRESVVLLREDRPGDPRLVAYVTPDLQMAWTVHQVLHLQQEGLPVQSSCYELPNGLVVIHKNKNETDFVYREIFEKREYLSHGITLPDNACIFDVGANIGLFSLFASQYCPQARLFAFEPIPEIFELLRLNMALYGVEANLFECALSNQVGTATFTYYPHVSILSGRFANAHEERDVVRSFLLHEADVEMDELLLEELLEERLKSEQVSCRLQTLSGVMREQNIERIDLLKIDVEKSELAVLQGIGSEDWSRIQQVVIEVHDSDGNLKQVVELLTRHGYAVNYEQQGMLGGTNLLTLYATRARSMENTIDVKIPTVSTRWYSPQALTADLRGLLQRSLPEYMLPSAIVVLEQLPLTPNGKLDRRALPVPEQVQGVQEHSYVAPRTPLEEQIAGIWAQVLGLEQVSVEDDFFVIGGHSLLATRLVMQLREQFSIEFSLRNIFEASTLANMARMVDEFLAGNTTSTIAGDARAWYKDAVLDPAIRADDLQPPAHDQLSSCTSIFLTGATGFLGAHLLFELLQQTQATIYCLVRADSMEQGRRRLYQQLNAYQLWQETIDTGRIVSVPGDLGSPLFGLSRQEFDQLAGQVEVIYHNGASVNIIAPYPLLKGANVLGTQEVLRLASTKSLKPVHYVSTLSVLATSGDDGGHLISEQVPLDLQREYMTTGYAQSKWNAEKLVQQALERGIPACIYRPGRISGHTRTGVWNPDDYLCRVIRGCIQLGSVPDVEEYTDMTPVDYLSQAIVHLSQHAAVPGKVFHLFNPVPATVAKLVAYARSFGYQLERPPYNEWRARVQRAAQEMSEHAFAPILTFFPETQSSEEESETGYHTMFMATNTRAGLADMAPYPSINERLIHVYLSFLLQKGLLPSPSLVGHE